MSTTHSVSPVVVKVGGRTTVIEIVFVSEVFAFEVACTVTVLELARFVGARKVTVKSVALVRQGLFVLTVPEVVVPRQIVFDVGIPQVTPSFLISPETLAVSTNVWP
jgi:hypothetical protein